MFRATWRKFGRPPFSPPLLMIGTVALMSLAAAQLTLAAQFGRSTTAADCGAPTLARSAVARHVGPPPAVAAKLDARGQFTGRGLAVAASGRTLSVALPAESFVGQPVGDALVYALSSGALSEVHVVDLGTGCDSLVARPKGVVRSAIIDTAGSAIYVHSVSYPARSDQGVTRYALDSGATSAVLPPLPADDRFGLTFGTQLGWSTDGTTLFAQSCAAEACRTRTLDIPTGATLMFDSAGQGQVIGLTPRHLVTFADCSGLPCPVISTDVASGATSTVANLAWSAALVAKDAGNTVARIDTAAGTVEVAQ